MPTTPKTPRSKPKTARERMPDLRDPKVRAEIRREAKLLAAHPENDEIDKWIESVIDPRDWS